MGSGMLFPHLRNDSRHNLGAKVGKGASCSSWGQTGHPCLPGLAPWAFTLFPESSRCDTSRAVNSNISQIGGVSPT